MYSRVKNHAQFKKRSDPKEYQYSYVYLDQQIDAFNEKQARCKKERDTIGGLLPQLSGKKKLNLMERQQYCKQKIEEHTRVIEEISCVRNIVTHIHHINYKVKEWKKQADCLHYLAGAACHTGLSQKKKMALIGDLEQIDFCSLTLSMGSSLLSKMETILHQHYGVEGFLETLKREVTIFFEKDFLAHPFRHCYRIACKIYQNYDGYLQQEVISLGELHKFLQECDPNGNRYTLPAYILIGVRAFYLLSILVQFLKLLPGEQGISFQQCLLHHLNGMPPTIVNDVIEVSGLEAAQELMSGLEGLYVLFKVMRDSLSSFTQQDSAVSASKCVQLLYRLKRLEEQYQMVVDERNNLHIILPHTHWLSLLKQMSRGEQQREQMIKALEDCAQLKVMNVSEEFKQSAPLKKSEFLSGLAYILLGDKAIIYILSKGANAFLRTESHQEEDQEVISLQEMSLDDFADFSSHAVLVYFEGLLTEHIAMVDAFKQGLAGSKEQLIRRVVCEDIHSIQQDLSSLILSYHDGIESKEMSDRVALLQGFIERTQKFIRDFDAIINASSRDYWVERLPGINLNDASNQLSDLLHQYLSNIDLTVNHHDSLEQGGNKKEPQQAVHCSSPANLPKDIMILSETVRELCNKLERCLADAKDLDRLSGAKYKKIKKKLHCFKSSYGSFLGEQLKVYHLLDEYVEVPVKREGMIALLGTVMAVMEEKGRQKEALFLKGQMRKYEEEQKWLDHISASLNEMNQSYQHLCEQMTTTLCQGDDYYKREDKSSLQALLMQWQKEKTGLDTKTEVLSQQFERLFSVFGYRKEGVEGQMGELGKQRVLLSHVLSLWTEKYLAFPHQKVNHVADQPVEEKESMDQGSQTDDKIDSLLDEFHAFSQWCTDFQQRLAECYHAIIHMSDHLNKKPFMTLVGNMDRYKQELRTYQQTFAALKKKIDGLQMDSEKLLVMHKDHLKTLNQGISYICQMLVEQTASDRVPQQSTLQVVDRQETFQGLLTTFLKCTLAAKKLDDQLKAANQVYHDALVNYIKIHANPYLRYDEQHRQESSSQLTKRYHDVLSLEEKLRQHMATRHTLEVQLTAMDLNRAYYFMSRLELPIARKFWALSSPAPSVLATVPAALFYAPPPVIYSVAQPVIMNQPMQFVWR